MSLKEFLLTSNRRNRKQIAGAISMAVEETSLFPTSISNLSLASATPSLLVPKFAVDKPTNVHTSGL
jgi:hypothetical protein